MDKNYNFERKKLMLPEYGRHVHQMVDYLKTIHDRDLRNQQARAVIEVMGNLNPILRESADFKHKLWDHLFIMSDFDLDVDSPYPIPTAKSLYPKPDRIEYPKHQIARKHYGKNIENMLAALKEIDDEEAKTQIAGNIAKFMRAKSFEYNQEHPNNEVIMKDIRSMSDNRIVLDEVALNNLKNDYKQPYMNNRQRKNYSAGGHSGSKANNYSNKQGNKRRIGKAGQRALPHPGHPRPPGRIRAACLSQVRPGRTCTGLRFLLLTLHSPMQKRS